MIIQDARNLIAKGWCRGNYAQNWLGFSTNISKGRKFCLVGALRKVCNTDDDISEWEVIKNPIVQELCQYIEKHTSVISNNTDFYDRSVIGKLIAFNDQSDKKTVLKILDDFILARKMMS
jgi:hypothetical protein